jgi:hypothetical protein
MLTKELVTIVCPCDLCASRTFISFIKFYILSMDFLDLLKLLLLRHADTPQCAGTSTSSTLHESMIKFLGQFLRNHTSILIQTFMLASLLYTVVDDHSKE